MSTDTRDWSAYYDLLRGRSPRQLLAQVTARFAAGGSLHAIDLGFGDGTETLALLSAGWHVYAIDNEPVASQRLWERVPEEHKERLKTAVMAFEDLVLPEADLVHASFSLPFCRPEQFVGMWDKIIRAVAPNGRFAGQFFGVNDSWAHLTDMTFHTEKQVRALLTDFDIESFHEQDEDGQASAGDKHWHIFTVIARKGAMEPR